MPRDNAALPVDGYKPQSDVNIGLVNVNKQAEERVLRVLDSLRQLEGIDQRWLAAGRTDIEKGFMAVNRAIMQPGRVKLPGDAE